MLMSVGLVLLSYNFKTTQGRKYRKQETLTKQNKQT